MDKCIATFRKHYLDEVDVNVRHACHLQLVLKDGSLDRHEKPSITREDIFKPVRKATKTHTPVKRVIVEGCAGMGKSTFCISVARDWAIGKLFQEYELLLLLPLSQRKIASASSLRGWIDGLKLKINSRVVTNHIKHRKGEGVLLIADGWNDLRESERQVFRRLLFGDLLSCASVIVTSRPTASSALCRGNIVDRIIEILGLNSQGIEEYMLSKPASNHHTGDNLLDQLNYNPVVQSMCRIPICCTSVCHLWHSHCGVLPISMTELCTKLILSILCNNCSTSIPNLDSLQKPLQEPWRHLCKLAFQLISRGEPDILQFNSFQCGIMTFGFVEYDETKEGVKAFDFFYPTSQEYLAALHLVKQPPANQLQALDTIRLTCKETTLFWRYFFGLSVEFNQHHFTDILKRGVQVIRTYDLPQCLLCHCAFEAKSEAVTSQTIKCLRSSVDNKSFVHFGDPSSAHDCEAVLYVISNMKGSECDGIEINFNNCNFSTRQASALADMLALNMGKIQVKDLDLSDNSLPDDTLANLFSKAVTSFRSLEKLFIRNNVVSQKGISAIMEAMSASSSKSLVQLDLSFNPLTLAGLQVLNGAIKSGMLANLAILFMQGCLTSNVSENVNFLCSLASNLLSRCSYLRRLDLSANDFGKGVTPTLSRVIMQLSKKVDLRLNREYMSEVDKSFVAIMEDSIRRKGTIDHTVIHGVIVGPGRSGKNSLMNRLVGEGPPDPNMISPSTGVLENVLKIEVKKLCTVAAAVNNLLWKRLDYDEEALELMMVTASSHTTVTVNNQAEIIAVSTNETDDPKKNITSAMILVEEETEESSSIDVSAYPFEAVEENEILEVSIGSVMHMSNSKGLERKKPPPSNVKSSEGPLEIFKRAVKLRRMDALREHLESSWSLYLTNTGGQTEFQELLPLLVCGPSVFFITFPLHQSLHEHYMVDYQYSDGSHKTYPSSSTLMDEILQTLATIAALDCTGPWTDVNLKPKVFFVGTHKDKLPDDCVNDKIQAIDKQLQEKVRQTSLFKQGSIEFAVGTEKLIYAVNNLAQDDGDFKMIRLGLQKAVERCEEFTIKCPSTWLIFSLILRAKHKSSQVLSYSECYTIAQRCGISDRTELNDALFFIHTRLGLLCYFCIEKLNKLVVIDPQIMFDTITKVLVKTFVSDHAKVNEIEEFQKRGIISQKVIKRISSKRSHLQSQLPFEWILCLLDHLRIAAFFMNNHGEKCYFVPSALCHAPEQEIKSTSIILPIKYETPPPLLIAFESGFCPRGIPGALITYLMTNEMKSKISWKLHSNRVFRNQVSFGVGPCDIILKVLSTHLEVKFDPESEVSELSEIKLTCEEAFNQLRQAMRTVTKGYRECNYYFAFNCTRSECNGRVHPARIELDSKKLKCERTNRRSCLPQHYDLWVLQVKNESRPVHNQLDMVIDSENNGVSKHLGQIADAMYEWEGRIADELGLSVVDVAEIKLKHPSSLKLQTRAALESWKQKLGDHATYNCLVNAFKCAGYQVLADAVKNLLPQTDDFQRDDNYFGESFTSQPIPTPPPQQPVFPTIATKVLLHKQGKEEEHQVEIETKEVTSFRDFFKRQTSMLSSPSDHETEDDCADCNPLEKVSHEVEIQSDSDVANYEDSTSISPTQSTSSSSESLQEYNCDVVVGHDCQLEGDAIEEGDGNGQGRVSDEICNSKRLGQRQDSTPEEMPITEQPREMHSTTFEDSTLPKEDDIANSDGTTISATQRTVESEPWSRSDMESSEDNVPPTALTHSQDSHGAAGPMSPSRENGLIADDDEEEDDDEFGVFETLVTAHPAKAESEFSQQDTLVITEDQRRASPLGHTTSSSSFAHRQFAQLAEHPRQFIYTPPDSSRGPSGPPAQPRPQEQDRRPGESGGVPHGPGQPSAEGPKMSPEIRKYRRKFSGEILCGALWGVNLFIGTDNGLLLLDRSGHGKVFSLITRRKFSQIEVVESHNVLVCINGRKNKLRVYYLSWLRNKILRRGVNYDSHHTRHGFESVGDLVHCIHYRMLQLGKIMFLVIGTKTSVEVYAWAAKPYSKFMAFKSFPDLREKPVLVDMIAETANRTKVLYASTAGFHTIDMETGLVQDFYVPSHERGGITPHAIIALSRPGPIELLLCYDNEGVYVNSTGGPIKDTRLQWGDPPSSIALIGDSHMMGWGSKAIEIRAVDNGQLDGVFMHKRTQKLRFLCEKNDKVFFASIRYSSNNSQVYFMALNRKIVPQ